MSESAVHKNNTSNIFPFHSLERVLVIDDNDDILKLIQVALRKKYDVVAISPANSIIKTIESCNPTVIFVDVNMPNIDGFEVISQIHRHPLFDDIPIVAMSGTVDQQIRDRLDKMGVIGFFQKPFDIKLLPIQLNGLLNGLNSTVLSHSGRKIWFNAFSMKEKKKHLNDIIGRNMSAERKCIFITWEDPTSILNPDILDELKNNNLCCLQIKPSLIPRFSFMQAFLGLIEEIIQMSELAENKANIIFDDPMRLYRTNDKENSICQLTLLLRELEYHFHQVTILNVLSQDESVEMAAHKLAKEFIG